MHQQKQGTAGHTPQTSLQPLPDGRLQGPGTHRQKAAAGIGQSGQAVYGGGGKPGIQIHGELDQGGAQRPQRPDAQSEPQALQGGTTLLPWRRLQGSALEQAEIKGLALVPEQGQQGRLNLGVGMVVEGLAQGRGHHRIAVPSDALRKGRLPQRLGQPPSQHPHGGGSIQALCQNDHQIGLGPHSTSLDRRQPGLQGEDAGAQPLQPLPTIHAGWRRQVGRVEGVVQGGGARHSTAQP